MRARQMPSAQQLRLRPLVRSDTPDEDIANAVGDPAYLHEIGECIGDWSRKQLEQAINRLLKSGRIVSYGKGTRRLYASPRIVEEILSTMPAAHVRLLQYMPIAGGVEHRAITRAMSQTSPMVDALVDAGLIIRLRGLAGRQALMLTAFGRRVRETLGDGIALTILSLATVSSEVKWWPLLDRLATTGSVATEGRMDLAKGLINHGYAMIEGDHLLITETGREAYHARIDLLDLTRMIEGGISPAEAHHRLAQQHSTQNGDAIRMAKTAAPKPTSSRRLHAYLLMRTDMPSLGIGKARAQAMYAGNNMTYELYVKPLKAGRRPHDDVETWHAQGAGFGTAIAIGARNEMTLEVLKATIAEAERQGFMSGLIVDDQYPYNVSDEMYRRLDPAIHTRPAQRYQKGWRCFCRETTAGWILGDKAELEELLSRFNLTPHAERERDQF